jgi:hypothetical protein
VDYNDYLTRVATTMVQSDTADPDWLSMLSASIDYAEKRIYRELDLLDTLVADTSLSTTANNRLLPIGNATLGRFVKLASVNAVTPTGVQTVDDGTRVPLSPVSKEWLNAVYPSSLQNGVPAYYALIDSQTLILGPWPDQAYKMELIGNIRPVPLSSQNSETILSLYFPDLMFAAGMIHVSGFMRNFGSQADNPQMAMSWETVYEKLKEGASIEEAKKALGAAA